jgi:hypothetical protein
MFWSRDGGKKGIKALIDPGQAQQQEMIEALLTPAHPDPFEALLNQPLAGTFHHARAERPLGLLESLIADMTTVTLKIGLHLF